MRFHYLNLDQCSQAEGIVVVIDVLRAFSTAAYAFEAGVDSIAVVGDIEEAFELQRSDPDLVLIGEQRGWPVEGFDFGNAPSEMIEADLKDRRAVMRTTAGTQGVVRTLHAEILLAASLVCGHATAEFIRQQQPGAVSFIITGVKGAEFGDEDQACADYIVNLLMDRPTDIESIKARVINSGWGMRFNNPDYPFLEGNDLELCTAIDRFDFYMLYENSGSRRAFRRHRPVRGR